MDQKLEFAERLQAAQRKLIREVILTFAKVHQGGAAPRDASAGKACRRINQKP
jgi:hypothetical protein